MNRDANLVQSPKDALPDRLVEKEYAKPRVADKSPSHSFFSLQVLHSNQINLRESSDQCRASHYLSFRLYVDGKLSMQPGAVMLAFGRRESDSFGLKHLVPVLG